MKIFSRYYTRRLYWSFCLLDILDALTPWVKEILYEGSPFLRQVATYYLRPFGSSYAPRFFKTIIAGEILRLNEMEDLHASLFLSIIEAHSRYDPDKGNTDLVNWLSWTIPYEFSKLVTWRVTHPITPFEEAVEDPQRVEFESVFEKERQVVIMVDDLGLSRQLKYYYLNKLGGKL